MEEENDLRGSMAFKEYVTGERTKIKHPWLTIVFSGILVAVAMVFTNWIATALHGNPYSFNFILALYGIPAGFVCAWKNKTLSAITSLRYSSYSALIATASYFLITVILLFTTPAGSAAGYFSQLSQLVIACLIICVFFVCVTFAAGAIAGTFIQGIRDSKN
ncbi:MAG: hypothetical protein FK732_08050 [Asgard group archaeon]|nr:hypothetical protein [Asgard group archaeon]